MPAGLTPGEAWTVEVTIVSLDRMSGAGDALAEHAALLTATRGASVVLPSSRLTCGARYAAPDKPAEVAAMAGGAGHPAALLPWARGVVPVGVTAAFKVAEELPREDGATGRLWRRGIEVEVFRPAPAPDSVVTAGTNGPATAPVAAVSSPIQVALAIDDFAQPDRMDRSAERPAPAAAPSPQHEVAIVNVGPEPNAQTFAFAVPFQFQGRSGQALAAIVMIAPPSNDPGQLEAFADCVYNLRISSAIAAARPRVGVVGGDEGSALLVALAALKSPERRRSAFIYLAGVTGADLCADAALVADDATLARVAGKVASIVSGDAPERGAIGWLLDQTWLLDMSELMAAAKLPPELAAVLASQSGEVGRHQSSIEEVGKAAHSRADYESLLLQENMIFLEDSAPSARSRAFDWLEARGKAPAGYKPLAGYKERRDALERAALGLPPPSSAPATEPTTRPTTEPATQPQATPSQEAPHE